MQLEFNPKTGKPQFVFENSDFEDAYSVKFLIQGSNCPHCKGILPKSWAVLEKLWQIAHDRILVEGMDGIHSKAKRERSVDKWACLEGFTKLRAVPVELVKFADVEIERIKKEDENGGSQNGI